MKELKVELDYLIIACHPDDEVIGCSSIILDETAKVGLVHITKSGDNERDLTPLRFCLDYYYSLGYPTFNVKCEPNLIDALTNLIEDLKPKTVLGHLDEDNHQDHRELAKALNIVLRSNRTNVKKYLQYYIEKPFDFDSCLFKKVNKNEKIKLLNHYFNYINKKHYLTILKYNDFCGVYSNMGFAEPFKIKYIKE